MTCDRADLDLGMFVLAANVLWESAPLHLRLWLWLAVPHETFTHLGRRCRIAWWRGRPYLLSIREGA